MNEAYLHYLWSLKRIPLNSLFTNDGIPLIIIDPGIYNEFENGPDFFNAKIQINNLVWVGNIEIHVKSSDWYLHKHQLDESYNNVILHVVYKHDKEIFINDECIPVLELCNGIDHAHYNKFNDFGHSSSNMLCSKSILDIDPIYLSTMMDKSIVNRLNRKIERYRNYFEDEEVLYHLFGEAFGMKSNKMAFLELTTRLPYTLIKNAQKRQKQALIQLTTGLFTPDPLKIEDREWIKLLQKEKLSVMNQVAWKKSGFRSCSSPFKRVKEFAEFTACFDFKQNLINLTSIELIRLFQKAIEDRLKGSRFLSSSILINAIVPYLYWKSEKKSDSSLFDLAISVLELIPPEKNNITEKWKECKITPKNSYESQALIELYNEYCRRKKCLSCDIGNKVLNR